MWLDKRTTVFVLFIPLIVFLIGRLFHSKSVVIVQGTDAQLTSIRIDDNGQTCIPLLVSEVRSHDSGAGFVHLARFPVTNTGNQTAALRFASQSCACLGVQLRGSPVVINERIEFAAHESTLLELRVRVPPQVGTRSYEAQFRTDGDSADASRMVLRCSVPILADAELRPDALFVDLWPDHRAAHASATLDLTRRNNQMKFQDPIVSSPAFADVRTVRMGQAKEIDAGLWKQTWTLDLTISPGEVANSPTSAPLTLKWNDGDEVVNVPIIVREHSGVHAPKSIAFAVLAPGQRRRRKVLIHAVDNQPFDILEIESDSRAVMVTPANNVNNTKHWLEIECEAPAVHEANSHRSRVIIRTNHPDSPTIEILVSARLE